MVVAKELAQGELHGLHLNRSSHCAVQNRVLKYGKGAMEIMPYQERQLSGRSVSNICSKLIEAKAGPDRLLRYQSEKRALSRNYLMVPLRIHEASNPDVQGLILDITDKGLQITGIRASVGETKKFLIAPSEVTGNSSVRFQSECRWSQKGYFCYETLAGFEITNISDRNSEELQKLIRRLTLA